MVVSPVKPILSTRGSLTSASPTMPPGPGTTETHPGRHSGLDEDLAEPDRREGSERRGLDDHRVAARERRRGLPGGDQQREVPRHDERAHADGLAQDEIDAGVLRPARPRRRACWPRRRSTRTRRRRRSPPSGRRRSACPRCGPRGWRSPRACSRRSPATRRSTLPRAVALCSAHTPASKASRAAWIAASTSAVEPAATVAMTSPVAGSRTFRVAVGARRTGRCRR